MSTLIFGYGNPGRGDDGLAMALLDELEVLQLPQVIIQRDMQLQIEHVTDLAACEQAVFIDADVSCAAPFVLETIHPALDHSYSSHAVTPAALLYCYQQVYHLTPPPCYLLRIRGYQFELGQEMTSWAQHNLIAAKQRLITFCTLTPQGAYDACTGR